ncbi:MAG: bifunctional [glutamine synthetase] adenylyltransferase/[glutamine synthetase]-adenylyl-L-tyrosine phosphorylase, partial [Pseudomonadota bacterium]
ESQMPRPLGDTPEACAKLAGEFAPYLGRLLSRDGADLDLSGFDALETELGRIFSTLDAAAKDPWDMDTAMSRLRRLKRRAHLIIALLDLSIRWGVDDVTAALTRLADASVVCALATASAARGVSIDGLFIIAFGKMGAFELNYSSDIDMAAFFNPDRFSGGDRGPVDTGVRVVKDVCRLLDTQTEDGYVFRTDLRLRPDPGSTPVAVSTKRAENYYQSVGQNWERMAWIKARPCAGDLEAAAAFQDVMAPFIWRRHLDYWALADVHAIKRMINDQIEDCDGAGGFDVKLGAGGIREIEFFAQTQQVIIGGRDPDLRIPKTVDALEALRAHGHVSDEVTTDLVSAYRVLRSLEHRVQMLNDEQTHTLPQSDERRLAVARLMGFGDLEELDRGVLKVRQRVMDIYRDLFAKDQSTGPAEQLGNLVFTGVDDDPGTLATLARLGFGRPADVVARMRKWHYGNVAATRSRRGQELLTAITPQLLLAMSLTGEPTQAFAQFTRFFEGLNAGIQVLSMLEAEPDILSDLVSTLAIAPRLANILARRPNLLEALLTDPGDGVFELDDDRPFEEAIDQARRFHRDQTFLIGHRLLNGLLNARDAAAAWTHLADQMVQSMAKAAARETERRFGAAPGQWCVFGMGSLGAGELTAASDLDLLVIYDLADGQDGSAQAWFTRFTQRLVTALSAPTAEGLLYEVDLRLRPSGRSGPVAVRLPAFDVYHHNDAWTWEHMALTRMRHTAGDSALAMKTREVALSAIDERSGRASIAVDIADMRGRLHNEKPGKGLWDLKLDAGGLTDIEFHVQRRLLERGGALAIAPDMLAAFDQLAQERPSEREVMEQLSSAWIDLTSIRQVLAIAVGDPDPGSFSVGLRDRLCRAVRIDDFPALEALILKQKSTVMEALSGL